MLRVTFEFLWRSKSRASSASSQDIAAPWRGDETITTQPVAIQQTGATLQIKALALAAEQEHTGDYLWRGELRLWGTDTLMGW